MKRYLVTGTNGGFYWYFKYDCSATALLQPACVFEHIEEAERVFNKARRDKDAEKVTLYEIDEDSNKRIVKRIAKQKKLGR